MQALTKKPITSAGVIIKLSLWIKGTTKWVSAADVRHRVIKSDPQKYTPADSPSSLSRNCFVANKIYAQIWGFIALLYLPLVNAFDLLSSLFFSNSF